jgi:predicted pyridoxine 5'-phosphate oxidase superfamily flavin-nucleotide-binding protein
MSVLYQSSPWYNGKLALQPQSGKLDRMDIVGRRLIRGYLPEPQREFFGQSPMLILGTEDSEGQPCASMVFGEPGFVQAPSPDQLMLALE